MREFIRLGMRTDGGVVVMKLRVPRNRRTSRLDDGLSPSVTLDDLLHLYTLMARLTSL